MAKFLKLTSATTNKQVVVNFDQAESFEYDPEKQATGVNLCLGCIYVKESVDEIILMLDTSVK